jgi:hypothetical protein
MHGSRDKELTGLLPLKQPRSHWHLLRTAQVRNLAATQLIPGCQTYNDYLSCSHLSNLCAYSKGVMTLPECSFFSTNSKTNLLYANSSGFSLSFNPKATIKMKLV